MRARHRKPWFQARWLAVAGILVAAAGVLVVVRVITAPRQLPPVSAQQVPASVGTSAPTHAAVSSHQLASSVPVRVLIPAISVNAPVMKLGLAADDTLQVPPLGNHNLAGWYDRSVTPGRDGTSVILGHVDNYAGPSVFYSLKTLHRGDKVGVVLADGKTAQFTVDGVEKVAKDKFPTQQVFGRTSYPSLRLITCGGTFDPSTGSYLDNIIVFAHLS